MSKAINLKITKEFLDDRSTRSLSAGFPKQKWIEFSEILINEGYTLYLDEAITTLSKYITVVKGNRSFKVRFSNHKPARIREEANACDFFVGVNNYVVTTTDDALVAVRKHFNGNGNEKT